jgi:molecular chaperone DnaJ
MERDFYEVLGVRRGATAAELRRAHQRLVRQLHPALNPGDPRAVEGFLAVTTAFELLSDPERRAAYDRGEKVHAPEPCRPEGRFLGFDFSAEMRIEHVGFREIFDGVLRRPAETLLERSSGEDLEQVTRLTFDEAFHGTRRRLHLARQEPCAACEGQGEVAFGPFPCRRCNGAGQVRGSRGHMIFSRPCSDCGGSGSLSRKPCAPCRGEGRRPASEWLEVEIPPGVASGSRVRLAGCGNAGRRGGPAGDFRLAIEVEPHSVFRREGDDLFCEVAVDMVIAALGGHVEVPTPEGAMTIELPAGTQNGQRSRLRKRGMPKLGEAGRGDLYVEARVVVPAVTDDPGRALLREFARQTRVASGPLAASDSTEVA